MQPALPFVDAGREALALLISAGVPIPGVRTGSKPDPGTAAHAVRQLAQESSFDPWILEAVGAFTLAWAQEYPTAFHAAFGPAAADACDWSRRHTPDRNRYLKLRRIALANLAMWL